MRLFGKRRNQSEHDPIEISEKDGVRFLHLGGHAVQSAMRLRDPVRLELEYTRAMFMCVLFNAPLNDVGLIGLGGGSIAKFIHHHLPETRLTAIEINPGVVAAARGYFFLPADDTRLEVRVADGAAYVQSQSAELDALLVDGYDAQRIVEDLATPGFYRSCLNALRPGGVAVFNLWGSDRYFDTYLDRIGNAFAQQYLLLPAEKKGNIQVFAFKPPLPHLGFVHLARLARDWEARLGIEFPRFLERMRSVNLHSDRGLLPGSRP
jgi:spermidine synthase